MTLAFFFLINIMQGFEFWNGYKKKMSFSNGSSSVSYSVAAHTRKSSVFFSCHFYIYYCLTVYFRVRYDMSSFNAAEMHLPIYTYIGIDIIIGRYLYRLQLPTITCATCARRMVFDFQPVCEYTSICFWNYLQQAEKPLYHYIIYVHTAVAIMRIDKTSIRHFSSLNKYNKILCTRIYALYTGIIRIDFEVESVYL